MIEDLQAIRARAHELEALATVALRNAIDRELGFCPPEGDAAAVTPKSPGGGGVELGNLVSLPTKVPKRSGSWRRRR